MVSKPRKKRKRTTTKKDEARLPDYVRRLTAGERRLALELASPFTGRSKDLDTPALTKALNITAEDYYEAIKKADFNRYVKHLQETLFEGMARTAFNRQLLMGVARGDPQALKLYADIEHLKKRDDDAKRREDAPDPVAVDRLLAEYEEKMGATMRANSQV